MSRNTKSDYMKWEKEKLVDALISWIEAYDRRPVTEAAPGGCLPCESCGFVNGRPVKDCGYVGSDGCCEHPDNMTPECHDGACPLLPTPAPNREAELKVIEAAIDHAAEYPRLSGRLPTVVALYASGVCSRHQISTDPKCAVCFPALTALAQSEMKGETK